mmetsp:Transcript_19758/g.36793  ORF Transcript_19758/g.36793 Transcript_19758/m.36793 type:complete len:1713 (-) Transcript_19758:223-5361(-)
MKFVIQLAANFLGAVMKSGKKLFSLSKLNFVDTCVFCTTVFLAAGYYYPWCLIVAFVCMLPPLQEQLYLPEDGGAAGADHKMTLEEELQSKILFEEKELAREMTGGETSSQPPPSEETAGTGAATTVSSPDSAKERKKKEKKEKKERKSTGEKPRVGKSLWGLPTLRVRDSSGRIIEINSDKPVPVETEYFKGTILMMLRTDGDMEQYNRYEHHFNGKQRKFEVQFQGNMKNVPQGEVMLGGELQEKMDISFVTRALLSVITKFCMSLNPFLHFGFGETPRDDGMFELPHLTFPLFRVMDRVIVTPPGGELPTLGQELKEDEQQRKDRRAGRGEVMSFKQGYTYSFSFHSMYTDFSRWAICNFPGYKAIDIRGFFGQQHVNVVCYEISEKDLMSSGKALHYNAHKRYLLTLELKHVLCMSPEELEEAEQEEEDETGSASEGSESDDDDDDSDEVSTTDLEQPHFDGDGMDEESLAIAREMTDDQRVFDDLDTSDVPVELLHMPDESELIPGDSVVSLIAIPAPWEPWDQQLVLDSEPVDTNSKDFDLDINPRDGLSALRPAMDRSGGSRIMHGNAITHEDAGLSPKRTCFGVADVGGVAIRKECNNLPAVRFIPVTPPHISTSRLARLSLRRNSNAPANASPAPARRKSMLSALYPRRRSKSHAEKHSTITPDTTAATDKEPSHNGLRCGDAVQIQSATTNRFLTVHKGWWLGWSMEEYVATSSSKHNRIASKVLFTIHPTDSTGLKYMPHGTPLVAGMPFRLRSVRWPDWEVGCSEPGRQEGDRQCPVVLYYAKIKVRNHVPTSGPVKWNNSSKKVNPLCLSVMHEENIGGIDGRRRSMSSGSSDMMMSPTHTIGSTGFESNVGPNAGPKRLFGVSPTRIIHMSSDITGISGAKEESTSVATGSILTQFLAPLDAGALLPQDGLEVNVTVSGWVEVLNRSLNYTQLAYIITVSYKSNGRGEKATKWTTLRTQEDLEEIFTQIEDQNREEGAGKSDEEKKDAQVVPQSEGMGAFNSDGETGYISNGGRKSGGGVAGSDKDQWSVVDRDDEDRMESGSERLSARRSFGGGGSDRDTDLLNTPSRPQTARRGVLRRSRVNIQRHDIAPNHLYPADQNVLIMTNRIAKALSAESGELDSPSKGAFNSTDSLLSYDDSPKPRETVQHSSRDDGSGTQGHGENVSNDGGVVLESDRVTALKGYLSDSSIPLASTTRPSAESDPQPSASAYLAKKAFLSALSAPQILDTWFLSEDGDKYLRAPPPSKKSPPRMQVAIVARALWDSHWREEIAVVYPSYIAFYPLLAKKASWTLYLQELIGISHVADATSPLPGFSILRIETIGRLHYLAFSSKESCNIMAASVLEHFSEITFDSSMPLVGEMGDPRDRFVLKSGRWRPAGRRLILNARKFLFDIEEKSSSSVVAGTTSGGKANSDMAYSDGLAVKLDFSENGKEPYWKFAERLLQDVFRLELNSTSDADGLFPGREMIIKFLDETVKLKQINLQKDIKFSSPEALCFFTNIYHTLLMHARLVLGPPSQQDWANFFDTVCYEIGSDVFSLSEIEHCVLGGRLARPRSVPRYFAAIPRANDDHYLYALPAADRRMRFLVNYGSLSLLPTIYLMTPETMHNSLNEASIAFFESSMVVEMKKRVVTLPKICDVFGQDFGEEPLAVLRHILRYLNRDNWEKVSILLTNSKAPAVKFQDLKARSHTRLHLVIQK